MNGFMEAMAGVDEDFKQATPVAGGGGALFTDGRHQGIINIARVEENDYGWQLVIGLRGIDSTTKRPASIRKWTGLPPEPERMDYLAADLALLGYDFKERGLSGLQAACEAEEWIGKVVGFGVKTKRGESRDYSNVYLNQVLGEENVDMYLERLGAGGGEETTAVAANGATAADDDIPF